ncbi:hypothetical protein CEP54_012962 [Fusarium duplospermum]|uniref:2EXR domain-containing protein n=1 Tax=Fusarium duplospermum TaxID=1325734 RepID=A0A428P5R0_9HYPO|nr:hypothetical protein CEP54_012962 [Fusarium duplospermum]
MSSSTFHLFPSLPAELQLRIWELACLPSQPHSRGLHYVSFDNEGEKLMPFGWKQAASSEQHDPTNNRSAYLWHGGLWAACRASRAVVMKHSRLNQWKELYERGRLEGNQPLQPNPDWDDGRDDVHPGLILMGEGHDTWYLMVYPARDIFCVTFNMESVQRTSERPYVLHGFPFLGLDCTILEVENFAIEFDPSWNHALPDHIIDLRMEESSRGLLARMIDEVATFVCPPTLWIVDKSVYWRAKPDRDYSTVFYDCDGEYVEVSWWDTCRDPSGAGKGKGPVTCFIRKLASLCDWHYADFGRGDWGPGYHDELIPRFSVRRSIKLLARRDNQLKQE